MITSFKGKKISGILAVLPEAEYDYDEETAAFATSKTRRLKKVMGFGKRRAAKANTTTGDLCHYAMQQLLDDGLINVDDVGAIIVSTPTPDHFVPNNSHILHGEFHFPKDVVCIDLPHACCGYMAGIMEACMLLDHMPGKKALVFTGSVLCRKGQDEPLQEASFSGDAASVTVLENDASAPDIYFSMYTDGANRNALIIPAGAYRMPRSPETAIPVDTGYGDGTKAPYDDFWMNGSLIFNFVQKEVPVLTEEILQYAGKTKDEIDMYLFHQPNKFMLQKLAQRMQVPFEKLPMNVVELFGNCSSSTIPLNITYNCGTQLLGSKIQCCLAGYGAGLAWSAAVMELGNLDFCYTVISDL